MPLSPLPLHPLLSLTLPPFFPPSPSLPPSLPPSSPLPFLRPFLLPSTHTVLALILAVAALFAVSAGLGITLYHTANNNNNNGSNGSNSSNSSLCLTASCVELASLVLSGMDQSVDPCADFYNFSCGAWAQKNIVPEGKSLYLCIVHTPN